MSASLLIDGVGNWAFTRELDETKENVLGRSRSADIQLEDSLVSSHHAIIKRTNKGWKISDLESRNGITVNQNRVSGALLTDQDIVQIGNICIVFKCKEAVASGRQNLDATCSDINTHRAELQAAIDSADDEHAVHIPEMSLAREGSVSPSSDEEPLFQGVNFETERGPYPAVPALDQADLTRDDHLWIAERMSEVLGQLVHIGSKPKNGVFKSVLAQLQGFVGADNGFLMIPNPRMGRWVITAWVGDANQWTDFGKKHPVPLTIANKSFKQMEVLSNAVAGKLGHIESPSFEALNVHHYIAVPLIRNEQRMGLLYFDTRNESGIFRMRDIEFLERIGTYLVELDQRLEG